jgi:cytoskeleton protein RodZ
MNTTTLDEIKIAEPSNPGAQLIVARQQKGFSQEYVASKLHLRVRVIQLLEADDYNRLPQPVFIKGYLRAYAKLVGIDYIPLLEKFNSIYVSEIKQEKALWQQSKRDSNHAERAVRWFTALFAIGVLAAVTIWWQQNKEAEQISTAKEDRQEVAINQKNPEVRLTDLSKMQSLFSSTVSISPMEKKGE